MRLTTKLGDVHQVLLTTATLDTVKYVFTKGYDQFYRALSPHGAQVSVVGERGKPGCRVQVDLQHLRGHMAYWKVCQQKLVNVFLSMVRLQKQN